MNNYVLDYNINGNCLEVLIPKEMKKEIVKKFKQF